MAGIFSEIGPIGFWHPVVTVHCCGFKNWKFWSRDHTSICGSQSRHRNANDLPNLLGLLLLAGGIKVPGVTRDQKKLLLQSLSEQELRRQVLIPLFSAAGFHDVNEHHGAHEKGKDLLFREISRFNEAFLHGAVVSREDIVGTVGNSKSASRVLEQAEIALNDEFTDKYSGAQVTLDRCWVITSGRILPTAMESIAGKLKKQNLQKLIKFVDIDKLIELIDKWWPIYWSGGSEFSISEPLQLLDISPDGTRAVCRKYELKAVDIVEMETSKVVCPLLAEAAYATNGMTMWSPNGQLLAFYHTFKRGAELGVFKREGGGVCFMRRT